MIKCQVPIETALLAARAGFNRPRVLRLERRVDKTDAGAIVKSNHVVERRRLKCAAEIDECVAVVVQFIEQTDFRIQTEIIILVGLVAVNRVVEVIIKMPQHINSLQAGQQRKFFREIMLVFQIHRHIDRQFQILRDGVSLCTTDICVIVILLGFKRRTCSDCENVLPPEKFAVCD